MLKDKSIIMLAIGFLVVPIMVNASPGRTDSYGCHTCRTNSSKYGLSTGQYHCHESKSTSSSGTKSNSLKKSNNSKSTNKNSNKATSNKPIKSKDATLKSLTIEGNKVNISDNMSYTTSSNHVFLNPIPNNEKAVINGNREFDLQNGNNTFNIKVIAEDNNISKNILLLLIS